MIRVGVSKKRARDLGHLAQSGEGGMLDRLGRLPAGVRKILIHINNTNPILNESSERGARARAPRSRGGARWHGTDPMSAGQSIAAPWSSRGVRIAVATAGSRLPHPPSLQRGAEFGQGEPRADSGLGRESLLLPGEHPDQGRRHSRQLPRSRGAAQLGAAYPRSRRLRRGSGRNRFLAAAGGGCGPVARESRSAHRRAAGGALCRGRLCQLRAPAPWQEAICSSLTELFAPEIHKQRLANWPEHYRWIDPRGSSIFRAA